MSQRVIRRPVVEHLTGLSRSSIYAMIANGEFPAQIKIGIRAVGWRQSEIESWIENRSNQSADFKNVS